MSSHPLRKRAFDIAAALPAALVTLPVTAGLAIGSAIRFKASPFFHQPRLGHGGKVFRFWKIRTLPTITPETADKYQLQSVELPRFAAHLRYRHLDELPQLWQVVAGQMSLVGPRPEMCASRGDLRAAFAGSSPASSPAPGSPS